MDKKGVLVAWAEFKRHPEAMSALENRYRIWFQNGLDISAISKQEKSLIHAVTPPAKKWGAREMDEFPNLMTIAVVGTGYQNIIDMAAAKKRGIVITRTAAVYADTVSEFAIGALITLARKIVPAHQIIKNIGADKNARSQVWNNARKAGRALSELTVGLVGMGNIGRHTARKLRVLGVGRMVAWNRSERPEVMETARKHGVSLVPLEYLMRESDAVIVAIAQTPDTKGLINRELLLSMKKDALFINVGRGAVVDEIALAELLSADKIGGGLIDVFSEEPPFEKEYFGDLQTATLYNRNVILTPHIAAYSDSAVKKALNQAARNIIAVLEDRPEDAEIVN